MLFVFQEKRFTKIPVEPQINATIKSENQPDVKYLPTGINEGR